MKNKVELKELSTAELKERLDNERTMHRKMVLSHAVSPIENPNKIKESRKNIARCLTELRSREIAEQKRADENKQ